MTVNRVALVVLHRAERVDGLTDDELARRCTRSPAPGYPEEQPSVGLCLQVVMDEELWHHSYAMRDLAVLETRT